MSGSNSADYPENLDIDERQNVYNVQNELADVHDPAGSVPREIDTSSDFGSMIRNLDKTNDRK